MTDRFMSHREEFEEYRDDAAKNIQALATATSQSARDDLVTYAEGYISETERVLRILEVEARGGNTQARQGMQAQVGNFKQQVEKLKASLDRAKLVGGSQQRVAQKPTRANDSQKDALISTQQQIDRQDDLLYDADVIIEETRQIADNTTRNLDQQRGHLANARRNVDETREDANEAGDHLQSLQRKHSVQIVLLYVLIVLLVVGIIASVITKFK
ncbi:hypothetical protein Gpo141_00011395 [Globisporangium polare]